MSDLVGNPEDRFSHVAAQIKLYISLQFKAVCQLLVLCNFIGMNWVHFFS